MKGLMCSCFPSHYSKNYANHLKWVFKKMAIKKKDIRLT